MNEQHCYLDVVDRMNEHLSVVDHLTNSVSSPVDAVLYMLEREMRSSIDMLTELIDAGIEEEIHEEKKLSLKERILSSKA